jgi:outer membrane protein OmpA-like peptidoglycan-associated protein
VLALPLGACLIAASLPDERPARSEARRCWDGSVVPVHLRCPTRIQDPFFIFFDEGSDEIAPELAVILSNVMQAYRSTGAQDLVIVGHHSPSEPPLLAQRRAERVQAHLVQLGIPANVVRIEDRRWEHLPADGADDFPRRVNIYFPPLPDS